MYLIIILLIILDFYLHNQQIIFVKDSHLHQILRIFTQFFLRNIRNIKLGYI